MLRGAPDPRDEILSVLPAMRAFALSLARNASVADDLVQDTIVKAWKSFDSYEAGTNLQAWLFTILRNTYYSDLRKSVRERSHAEAYIARADTDGPGNDGHIAVLDFEKAFASLPDEQREALVLVGASGMSYQDAAITCGVAVGTIKSRINRGRKRLADQLGRTGDGNPA
ncbi:sigma-70 family RNA polymerase sigma factor [Yoonia sp.]|jgi:RNA polymerase sigma-70 factor (ECF subfamily)|uniref:sigma-70 family RNA polymerase sigma factor n=1 Tax=Yoonia sp. TaxID=2212373 RepID=UPI0025CDA438|nr:sigma-70 family RNA polymerase sigma factor [Yoonia sp.]